MLKDTIAAISTPLQEGAIGIIRLSGDEAIMIADKIFNRDLTGVASHSIIYGNIIEDTELIDEVLISVFRAPHSYTGEDMAEINCHGSTYLVRKILALCLANGARQALPGEFTERAFLNGRIDLTQAEAVNDLVRSTGARQAKMALRGLKGSVSRLLEPLIEDMLQVIAQLEVNIDYPEYDDIRQLSNDLVLPKLVDWQDRLAVIIRKAEHGRIISNGIETVIIGEPNVGKSSLLNALLEEDKAIVTEQPGTTRDLVEGMIRLDNVTLHLIDTAGLRTTADQIEKIGIAKTMKAISAAELVIIVLDSSRAVSEYEQELIAQTRDKQQIIVYNKRDLNADAGPLSISALHNDIQPLIAAIEAKFKDQMLVINEDILNNERQIGLARQAFIALKQGISSLEAGMEPDIILIDIELAYQALKAILGEVSQDDLLDTLFSNFCVGK